MNDQTTHKMLMGFGALALLLGGCANLQSTQAPPEGTWACTTEWSHEREGVTVSNSAESQCTCTDNVLSITGVVSIGAAQWSEEKEGTCYASGDELFGTWTSVKTLPKNDAARQFEQERFGGKSLAIATRAVEGEHRVRVTSRTDTQLEAVNGHGRVISCTRL